MPYVIDRLHDGKYMVKNRETGKIHALHTTYGKAKAQIREMEMYDHKKRGAANIEKAKPKNQCSTRIICLFLVKMGVLMSKQELAEMLKEQTKEIEGRVLHLMNVFREFDDKTLYYPIVRKNGKRGRNSTTF